GADGCWAGSEFVRPGDWRRPAQRRGLLNAEAQKNFLCCVIRVSLLSNKDYSVTSLPRLVARTSSFQIPTIQGGHLCLEVVPHLLPHGARCFVEHSRVCCWYCLPPAAAHQPPRRRAARRRRLAAL